MQSGQCKTGRVSQKKDAGGQLHCQFPATMLILVRALQNKPTVTLSLIWRGCRCAERMVLGEANITTAGAGDLEQVNNIAREMVRAFGSSACTQSDACGKTAGMQGPRPARRRREGGVVLMCLLGDTRRSGYLLVGGITGTA